MHPVALLVVSAIAGAGDPDPGPPDPEDTYETRVHRPPKPVVADLPTDTAGSEVEADDLDRRLPRSAPDALRYEPGVFVQQTAHSQGSAFIRGMTGQQTLMLFDGIRLNNSTYRQGPNQYFFTLDSQSIQSLQVHRGGASTRFGSDALGGVIQALPIEPQLGDPGSGWTYDPRLRFRGGTADDELGGRGQLQLSLDNDVAFIGGVGGRQVGRLESGGRLAAPSSPNAPLVPRFGSDNRTQLGTGFDELTADGRVVFKLSNGDRATVAAYAYRQFDAPRTDQCPAAYAPIDECLTYDEQFRTLVYGAWSTTPGHGWLKSARATLSWQRQRERRSLDRPSARVRNIGRDRVDTFGATLLAQTKRWRLSEPASVELSYGLDSYWDRLQSAAWITFTDIDFTEQRSRGQYLDGSTYLYGGGFVQSTTRIGKDLKYRLGGRVSWIDAQAPADADSGSAAVSRQWLPVVGNTGVSVRLLRRLTVMANLDYSFRAPNLDDLTSRQQTGPGFQFENAALGPERAWSAEVGARYKGPISVEAWAFHTRLAGAVIKSPRQDSDCPPDTPACGSSWTRFQLVNSDGASRITGVEGAVVLRLPKGFGARANAAWTRGDGPDVSDGAAANARVPLSRIPPVNGSLEVLWKHTSGLGLSSSLRWAGRQARLALSDVSDERIPPGGTPGFTVVDVRAIYRLEDALMASLAVENVFDAAYRYHGSSVNGPGLGVVLRLDLGPLWRL